MIDQTLKANQRQNIPFNWRLLLVIVTVMLLTRSSHIDTAVQLPDASLALFFIAGLYFPTISIFVVLFLVAVFVDFAAIAVAGVSDFCITPAYWFLIPTYAALWYAAKLYLWLKAKIHAVFYQNISLFMIVMLANTISFALSNYSFYFFSNQVTNTSLLQYTHAISAYYWPQTWHLLLYLASFYLLKFIYSHYWQQKTMKTA